MDLLRIPGTRSSLIVVMLWCVSSVALAAPPPAAGLELGARIAPQVSDQGLGLLTGVQADWRVVSMLALGVYGDLTPLYSPITLKCGGCSEPRERPARAGAFAELHVLPSGVADPFLRAGVGVLSTHRVSADSELGLGLDLRVSRFAVGPFASWIATFSVYQPKRWLVVGGRFVVAF